MKSIIGFILLTLCSGICFAQSPGKSARIIVVSEQQKPVTGANVQLLKTDSVLIKLQVSDKSGVAEFNNLSENNYLVQISHTGFQTLIISIKNLQQNGKFDRVVMLNQATGLLNNLSVTTKKPFIEFAPDKTVVNVDAGITNAGTSIMDVLEKSPGVTVGRDGTISMRGKPQVMILIDGKQTQLSGTDLQTYLSGISASQIDVIELIDNPGAKYDASGNSGIINIKTKKLRQVGFNGSLSLAIGHGFYAKSNNSLNLNYRNGKINVFLNYGKGLVKDMMKMYTLRKYFDQNRNDSLLLQQPNRTKTNINADNIKAGLDFFVSNNTTIGLAFTGAYSDRRTNSVSTIDWMTPDFIIDSTINTWGTRFIDFKRSGVNAYGNHTFSNKDVLSADVDLISFKIDGGQFFETQLSIPGIITYATNGNVPSTLDIFAAKLDYTKRFKQYLWEGGMKTAHTKTNNLAEYSFNNGQGWFDDLSRSNHFLYDESISSVYSSISTDAKKWQFQGGLRYENTSYKANQLGNAVVKD